VAHDRMAQRRVERGNRLVGEDQLRLLHQGPSHRHPLLLAAGERVGSATATVAQPHSVEAGLCALPFSLWERHQQARQQAGATESA